LSAAAVHFIDVSLSMLLSPGVIMRNLLSVFVPMGRLHDPILGLAKRVHSAMRAREKRVWADDRGSVFIADVDPQLPIASGSTIGTYDVQTPVSVIERDLRFALRERASQWIVDWNALQPVHEQTDCRSRPGTSAMGRSLRARAKMKGRALRKKPATERYIVEWARESPSGVPGT
jgi:hypothetical protein